MALTEPTYKANQLDITQTEAIWLSEQHLDHARRMRALADNAAKRYTESAVLLAELTVERDALPDGAEKTAITTQIDRIEKGANEWMKVHAKKWKAMWGAGPTAQDARQFTLSRVYDPATDSITAEVQTPGQMTLQESGWPSLVFTAVDANSNGVVTAAELTAYYDAL